MATAPSACISSTRLIGGFGRSQTASGRGHRVEVSPKCSWSIPARRRMEPLAPVEKHMENIMKVKGILMQVKDPMECMRTIDYLQKLCIDYHFKEEIESMLHSLHQNFSHGLEDEHNVVNLLQVALSFRLLRQTGYPISSDVFDKFTDMKGRFMPKLSTDVHGLLGLHEASSLSTGEDRILEKANEFSSKHLSASVDDMEPTLAVSVRHALKHPRHMTISRYNVRHFLDNRQTTRCRISGVMEELARFDFNLVQSVHQNELQKILRWWESTGLADELKLARNQPMKWYLWSMTVVHDPQFTKCRIHMTKVSALVYIIDDIFDVFGTPEELEVFTDAITKWDLEAIKRLPIYMQALYATLYNTTNEIAHCIQKKHGWNPIDYLRRSWARLCDAFLLESKWLRSTNIPKTDEYLTNAIISSGVHTVMMHAYFLLGEGITKQNADFLESNPPILSCPATILRLWDDLGCARDEDQDGFDGSYVECYMKEHPHCSTQDAMDHVKQIISANWKNLNKECFSQGHFAPHLVDASLNLARMSEVMYKYDSENLPILQDYISALLFNSI